MTAIGPLVTCLPPSPLTPFSRADIGSGMNEPQQSPMRRLRGGRKQAEFVDLLNRLSGGKPRFFQSQISGEEKGRGGLGRNKLVVLAELLCEEMNAKGITLNDLLRGSRERPAGGHSTDGSGQSRSRGDQATTRHRSGTSAHRGGSGVPPKDAA